MAVISLVIFILVVLAEVIGAVTTDGTIDTVVATDVAIQIDATTVIDEVSETGVAAGIRRGRLPAGAQMLSVMVRRTQRRSGQPLAQCPPLATFGLP
jgi:hypothetical protein